MFFSRLTARQLHAMRYGANMLWSLLALCCAIGLATMASAQAAGSSAGTYGKKLVETYELPVETLAQFARFVPKPNTNPATIFAETQNWAGKELSLVTSGNPYTMVVKVTGTAIENGDANAYFQPGWAGDNGQRMGLVIDVSKPGAKAGEVVQREASTGPISVKDDKALAPHLGFAGAKNMNITSVTVEVWSGLPKSSLASLLLAWSPLIGGLVFLGLFFWFRR